MKVTIEARALAAGTGGVRQYVRELVRCLHDNKDIEMELLVTEKITDDFMGEIRQRIVPLTAEWQLPFWLQWQVPRKITDSKSDLIHFTKVDVPTALDTPMVATVYDIIPLLLPETQSFLRRYYWPGALRRSVEYSRHIFTISEASKNHLVGQLGANPEKITVTPLGVDSDHFYERGEDEVRLMRERRRLSGPYVLFVGTRDRRKNIWALLRAWKELVDIIPHMLVLVGKEAANSDDSEALVEKWGLSERVQFWNDVSYNELPAIYSGAKLLVWPSIVEGWGLPPQEAMACGTPVIVSDGEPLPEVVGAAGEVVPFGVHSLEEAFMQEDFARALRERIERVLADDKKREQMRVAGLRQAHRNSWEEVARLTVEGYKKALL